MNNTLEVNFLGRHQRKALAEVKAHLPSENRTRPHTGTIKLVNAVIHNILQ